MESYDVVIVGAGLAGLQCTELLSAQGVSVLLIDRKAELSESVHTTGIFVRRTLDDFEIPEQFLGPSVRQVNLVSPAGREWLFQSPYSEFRVGRMATLYQFWLNRSIEQGASWRPSSSLIGISRTSDGSVVAYETDGQRREVAAKFVIGADGAMSRTAAELGLSENRDWIVGVESIYSSATCDGLSAARTPTLHCFVDPKLAPGYLGWIADDGEDLHIGVGGYTNRFQPKEALAEFIATSAKQVVDVTEAAPIEQRSGRIPVGGVLKRIVSPRGLLVGDAAGAVSPLTAGGLDPCMRLSALAAKVVGGYLQSGDEGELRPYYANRFRRRFRKRRFLRNVIASIRGRWLAETACSTLNFAPIHRFASRLFFAPRSFPIDRSELDPVIKSATQRAAQTVR